MHVWDCTWGILQTQLLFPHYILNFGSSQSVRLIDQSFDKWKPFTFEWTRLNGMGKLLCVILMLAISVVFVS